MTKTAKDSKTLQYIDLASVLSALLFMISVVMNVNVAAATSPGTNALATTSFGTWGDGPNTLALLIFLGLVAYSIYQRKKLTTLALIASVVVATSAIIWLFGIHARY